MKGFLAALQFLTIIRVSRDPDITGEDLGRSMSYYPVVGFLIGLTLVAVRAVFSLFLPLPVVDILVIAALVILSGALHLDGFADTVDGLAGGRDREKTLAIMRDNKIGSFAVVGLILLLILKVSALMEVPAEIKNSALLIMPVLGRWSTVQLASGFSYARSGNGTALVFTRFAGRKEYVISTLITAVILIGLFQLRGLVIMLLIAAITLLLGLFFKRRIGGVTGDIMGAANEINEVVTLLMICGLFAV
ncbi:MAG: adenosylcobinamide-GDP ribazoletransferase [Syntrophales bacterium]|nr:adenosylcobinamide-GDP ribazoletransferase [Syntrophales bacterium]